MTGDPFRDQMNYIANVWEMYHNGEIASATLKWALMPTSVVACILPESETHRRERKLKEKWDRFDQLRTKGNCLTGEEYFELEDLKKQAEILDRAALEHQLKELEKLNVAHQENLQTCDTVIKKLEQALENRS